MARQTRTVHAGGHVLEVEIPEPIPPVPSTCSICGAELVRGRRMGVMEPTQVCPNGHGGVPD
jgi:hypothetical protein